MPDKTIAQKLQIKPGRSVLLVSPPEGYREQLGVETLDQTDDPVDVIQVFVASRQALEEQLPRLKALLSRGGILWVTYYKGTARMKTDINRDSINAYAATLGMQGVAIIAVDQDWAALRLKVVA